MFEEPRGGLCGLTVPVIHKGLGFTLKSIGAPLKAFCIVKWCHFILLFSEPAIRKGKE